MKILRGIFQKEKKKNFKRISQEKYQMLEIIYYLIYNILKYFVRMNCLLQTDDAQKENPESYERNINKHCSTHPNTQYVYSKTKLK